MMCIQVGSVPVGRSSSSNSRRMGEGGEAAMEGDQVCVCAGCQGGGQVGVCASCQLLNGPQSEAGLQSDSMWLDCRSPKDTNNICGGVRTCLCLLGPQP